MTTDNLYLENEPSSEPNQVAVEAGSDIKQETTDLTITDIDSWEGLPQTPSAFLTQFAQVTPNFTIVNQNSPASPNANMWATDAIKSYIANPVSGHPALFKYRLLNANRKPVNAGSAVTFASDGYLWLTNNNQFHYKHSWADVWSGSIYPPVPKSINTNSPLPDVLLRYTQNGKVGVSTPHPANPNMVVIKTVTPLSEWLNDLLFNIDEKWPEAEYPTDSQEYAAYQFIVSQVNAAPNKGTVAPTIVGAITCPAGAAFANVFENVKTHLEVECSYFFDYLKPWFDYNGIIDAINTQIAIVAGYQLQGITSLMEMPDNSIVSLIMHTILTDIIGVVGIIPDLGPFISAILSVAISTVEITVGATALNKSIQVAVSDMAKQMTQYFEEVINTTATQLKIIGGNWGKLKAFATGVISGTISEDMFKMNASKPVVPDQYLLAAAKAWQIVIFKSLFAVKHTPTCDMNLQNPNGFNFVNPWNVDTNNFDFQYLINGSVLSDAGNGEIDQVYFIFNCKTNAPLVVKQKLFLELEIDPTEFYLGLNGWPRPIPEFFRTFNSNGGDGLVSLG